MAARATSTGDIAAFVDRDRGVAPGESGLAAMLLEIVGSPRPQLMALPAGLALM